MRDRKTSLNDLLSHDAWVRALARQLVGDPHAAEDVAQDAWVEGLESPPGRPDNLRAWLRQVVHHLVLKRARSLARGSRRERMVARSEALPSVEEMWARQEASRRVAKAVFSLEEPYRSTVLYRYFENLPPKEIAARLDVSVSAVHERLRRGLEKLRARLDREFGDRRSWCAALLPLIGRVPAPVATAAGGATTASILTGALVVSTKIKIGIAVLLAVGVAYAFWPRSEEPKAPPPGPDPRPVEATGKHFTSNADSRPATDGDDVSGASVETPHDPMGRDERIVASASPSPEPLFLRGTVSGVGGGPIPDATLTLSAFSRLGLETRVLARAETDAHGVFSIGPIRTPAGAPGPREVVLEARAAGCFAERRHCHLGTVQDFVLGEGGHFSGRVVVAADRSPCAGAQVAVYRALPTSDPPSGEFWSTLDLAPGRVVPTDQTGEFRFADLKPAMYRVKVLPHGLAPPDTRLLEVSVAAGEETKYVFAVGAGVAVRGRVVDRGTNAGIEGARIEDWRTKRVLARTDGKGRFAAPGIPVGPGSLLQATADGYCPRTISVTDARQSEGEMTVALDRGSSVSGRVIGPDDRPVIGAHVSARLATGDRASTSTDPMGRFSLSGLAANTNYNAVFVDAEGFASARRNVPPPRFREDQGELVIRLQEGGVVSGRVIDETDSPVVAGEVVLHVPQMTSARTTTDGGGHFRFENVAPGTYQLDAFDRATVQGGGSNLRRETRTGIVVEAGVERRVQVIMHRGAFIGGRVVDTDGRPVADTVIRVEVTPDPGRPDWLLHQESRKTLAQNDGSFLVEGLRKDVGSYLIIAQKAGYERGLVRGVAAGSNAVSVTLERLASVEGRVTVGRTGDPAREFLVETVQVGAAVEGRRPNQKTRSFVDLEGRFSCLLPAGTYEFSTRTASGLRSLPVTVHLPSGQEATHLDLILLQGGRVTGTVWGPDGTRVQEGWIAFYSADPDRSGGKVHSAPIADGRFGIGAFSSGRYLLRACDAAHPEWDLFKEVLVAPGTETRLKLGLGLAGRLSVRVVGDHGEPVPDARVGVRREDGVPIPLFSSKYVREAMERVRQGGTRAQSAFFPSFTRTDDAGSIHPRFLPSGRYVVEIAASGFDSRHEALSIASGRETSVEIRLLRRASR